MGYFDMKHNGWILEKFQFFYHNIDDRCKRNMKKWKVYHSPNLFTIGEILEHMELYKLKKAQPKSGLTMSYILSVNLCLHCSAVLRENWL